MIPIVVLFKLTSGYIHVVLLKLTSGYILVYFKQNV